MIKLLTVVGARPQFIKASALSLAISETYSDEISEDIVHTGQHFDTNMSNVFFDELAIPRPKHALHLKTKGASNVTGEMIHLISEVIEENRPDLVLVYGDTNSTLAGTISALQHFVPVAHVEAGMRSRNFRMPEEINRVLVDRVSALNFAPSASAMSNLAAESLDFGSHQVGDIVADVVRRFEPNARLSTSLANEIKFSDLAHNFALATFHRQGTLDTPRSLEQLVQGLNAIAKEIPIVLPTHPRLAMRLEEFGLSRLVSPNILMISPLGFLEMLALLKHASVVLTDSGGLQKEAFYAKVPCVTVRSETEWTETVELGWNRLSSVDPDSMLMAFSAAVGSSGLPSNPYGDGHTSEKIIEILLKREWTNFFS